MYGLPADFTGQAFVGRTLQYVAVFSNQLIFDFDGGCTVKLESSYSIGEPLSRTAGAVLTVPHFEPRLMGILDQKVRLVSTHQDGTLQMVFENGGKLAFYDPDERFEAYHLIWDGGGLIV